MGVILSAQALPVDIRFRATRSALRFCDHQSLIMMLCSHKHCDRDGETLLAANEVLGNDTACWQVPRSSAEVKVVIAQ